MRKLVTVAALLLLLLALPSTAEAGNCTSLIDCFKSYPWLMLFLLALALLIGLGLVAAAASAAEAAALEAAEFEIAANALADEEAEALVARLEAEFGPEAVAAIEREAAEAAAAKAAQLGVDPGQLAAIARGAGIGGVAGAAGAFARWWAELIPGQEFTWTKPQTLQEQLAMDEAQQGAGNRIMTHDQIDDPLYSDPAWEKFQHRKTTADGNLITIHYMRNSENSETAQYKFISRSWDRRAARPVGPLGEPENPK